MREWHLDLGASVLPSKEIHFKVWAPKVQHLSVVSMREGHELAEFPLTPIKGFFELTLPPSVIHDYFYRLNGQGRFPDPVSRWQPHGVHGPSRVYDPQQFAWTDHTWKGLPLKDYIIYELHIGTFTLEGTFEGAIAKLPYLTQLGITAIELMPVIEFPGHRNWGYDGVNLFAPHHLYGGPDGLKKLVDACHAHGLAVIIDVVYNHLGPEGNYMNQYGPYLTNEHHTPWGEAVNFDCPSSKHVREYFVNNTLYWLTEYHADALRLDAVHAFIDTSERHILKEIQGAFHKQAKALGRQAFIIVENEFNEADLLKPIREGGYGLDAQWSDDFHHAVQAFFTKSRWKYLAHFGQLSQVAKAITDSFVFENWEHPGQHSMARQLPGEQFIICIQNHDQIGNAGQGKRLDALITLEQYKVASLLLFCAPNIPLLFMGQEWAASSPFLYFTSFEDKTLGENVRKGYQKEFHLPDSATFDPQSEQRFLASKLKWEEIDLPKHKEMLTFYQKLIHLRKTLPSLSDCRKDRTAVHFNEKEGWLTLARDDLLVVANLSAHAQAIPIDSHSECLLATQTMPGSPLPPWSAKLLQKR